MSEGHDSSNPTGQSPQMLTAEYKDGQLQIVEVIPFDRDRVDTHILSDMNCDNSNNQAKYMQVLDDSKSLVQLDLLNLTLVRCQDGDGTYQLVANAEASDGGDINSDNTVTCVLQSSDNEGEIDHDNPESYVVMDTDNGQGPLVFLKSTLEHIKADNNEEVKKKLPSPAELLEKAKALQKAKALMSSMHTGKRRGRRRRGDLPPPHELLASPNFKLYLYSCKMCSFKCNAVKEMSAHKVSEHGAGGSAGSRSRGAGRGGGAPLQCARCPYRASTHSQLMKHVQEKHMREAISVTCNASGSGDAETEVDIDSADVLVCGACGYESSSRADFRRHIVLEHGASTC